MTSDQQVKQYVAYWFQLGKRVMLHNGKEAVLPEPVVQGDRYSDAFETCWQRLISPDSGECYLEGTSQTIEELLSSQWNISPCARCGMPVPVLDLGVMDADCPCSDLANWPNDELPRPRSPINNRSRLGNIRDRLQR
ncbi:hypothetical protein [Vacuolonema iberomarrocanum]|uniref:hypothetical protein n=1 Tax=Vacuolonema iberomarrocanum TaxID=3454632 RepID=UPI0019EF3121|nr:hypothetical protein [filamentous cyanobacterium LEGE 07170]